MHFKAYVTRDGILKEMKGIEFYAVSVLENAQGRSLGTGTPLFSPQRGLSLEAGQRTDPR